MIDGTVGMGGHAEAILSLSAPSVRLLGLDVDREALARAGTRLAPFGDRVRLGHSSFRDLREAAVAEGIDSARSILLDLGVSSWQLEESGRGFSFQGDEPLDMRLDPSVGEPAAVLLNRLPETELARLIFEYGEEPHARRIARALVETRRTAPVATAEELAALVERTVGRGAPGRRRIHPATRVFQALRIAVNEELDALQDGLAAAVDLLRPGGRLVVLSYH